MSTKQQKKQFEYNERDIKTLAAAFENAFETVGCDMRSFDWLSYNPDFYRKQENKKAA